MASSYRTCAAIAGWTRLALWGCLTVWQVSGCSSDPNLTPSPAVTTPPEVGTETPAETPTQTAGPEVTATLPPAQQSSVVINEVDCVGTDWVELYNPTSLVVLMTGWQLTDDLSNPDHAYTFPSRLQLAPGAFLVVKTSDSGTGLPFGIACEQDTVYLVDPSGDLQDAVSPPAAQDGATWGRLPDGARNLEATAPTQGFWNVVFGVNPTDWLYEPFAVPTVDITLDPAAWLDLTYNQFEYTTGIFQLTRDGDKSPPYEVGVRLKGYVGSYQTIDGKPSFKIKFDYTTPDGQFYGMQKLTFNNMIQDASMIHETLSYELFRKANVPSPRTGYVWIRVNGMDYGLYTNVEVPDDLMDDTWFESTQHIYEGAYGVDVYPGYEYSYEIDKGDPNDVSDLTNLITAANSTDDEWLAAIDAVTDFDEMLRMWALELYMGHWDGYPTHNNYFLHSDDAGRFVMEPWGTDQTFGSEMSFVGSQGQMFTRCMGIPACKQRYINTVSDLRSTIDDVALQDTIQPLYAFLSPYISADLKKPYWDDTVAYSVQATYDFLIRRRGQVDEWLSCERDGICPPCAEVEEGDRKYQLCDTIRSWSEARAFCQSQGMDLLVLNSSQESTFIQSQMAQRLSITDFWLGLSDLETEGSFVWVDGSPLTSSNWSSGEPNDSGGEDCAQIFSGGLWNDLPCGYSLPAVCESPCEAGIDADQDGFEGCSEDCNDADPAIHPGVDDVCADGIDQDCNGYTDDGVSCSECVSQVIGSNTYLFCSRPRTFDEARAHCQKLGADLTSVQSADEWNAVWSESLNILGPTYAWIGLTDAAEEYNFVWVDGAPVNYQNWSYWQPDNANNEDCVGTFEDGTWNDFPCTFSQASICLQSCTNPQDTDLDGYSSCNGDCDDTNPQVHPSASESCTDSIDFNCDGQLGNNCPGACVPFSTLLSEGQYFEGAYCSEPRAWLDAEGVCEGFGGTLAWFDNYDDQTMAMMAAIGIAGGGAQAWFGLNDRVSEGSYRWVDGSFAAFSIWASGQPNNGSGGEEQDCVRVLGDFTWNDTACDALYPFYCRL